MGVSPLEVNAYCNASNSAMELRLDPVAFRIGPLDVRWYGIMYVVGIAAGWWLGRLRARRQDSGWGAQDVDALVFYGVIGIMLGGHLGYILFYGLGDLLRDPLALLLSRRGMSFHGGLLGVAAALWLYGRRNGRALLEVGDFVAPLVPIGLGAGRIGNFINGELWGKPSDVPWAVIFPDPRAGGVPRHPSQLYEALLEGAVLFAVLWLYSRKARPMGAVSGLFLLLYGVFRFLVEFVRVPDEQLGYLAFDWLTLGQLLSTAMILAGALLLWLAYVRNTRRAATRPRG